MTQLTPATVGDVVDVMGLDPPLSRTALRERPVLLGSDLAWPIRLLTGFGAWLAGMFFLSVFACFGVLTEPAGRLIVGALLLVVATGLRWFTVQRPSDGATQLALSWVVAGQALVLTGVGETAWQDGDVMKLVVASAVAMALVLLVAFPDAVQRWASTVVATCGVAVLMALYEVPHTVDWMAVTVGTATAATWLASPQWLASPLAPWQRPVGFGLATSLCLILVTSVLPESDAVPSLVSAVGMAVLLIGVAGTIVVRRGLEPGSPAALLGVGGTAAIALTTWSAPGVSASMMVMALAIERRSRLLLGVAAVFLIGFGTAFYYWLDVSLLQKSVVLMSSGVLLLGIRMAGIHLAREAA